MNSINLKFWLLMAIALKISSCDQEAQAIIRNWPLTLESEDLFLPGFYTDVKHYLYVTATAKNEKNLLSDEILDELEKLNDYIQNGYTLVTSDGSNFTYTDICMTWKGACFPNSHVYLLRHRNEFDQWGLGLSPKIQWPITLLPLVVDTPIYLGSYIQDAVVNETDGTLLDCKSIQMAYFPKQINGDYPYEAYSLQWRAGIQKYLSSYKSDQIDITFWSEDNLLKQGSVFFKNPQVTVLVENVPNMTLSEGRQAMLDMASAFEDSPYSYGANASVFWLRQYLRFLNKSGIPIEDTQEQWCDLLKSWRQVDTSGQWLLSIRWSENACQIKAFRFFVASKDASVDTMHFFRNLAQKYSQYNVSTYNEYLYPYMDRI